MKAFICTVILLALLLSACSVTKQTPTVFEAHYTHGIYQLTFKPERISSGHVGNDWSFTYTYDGQTIESGHQIAYPIDLFTFLPIGVEVREKDNIDDVGTGILNVAICDGSSGKTQITVTETDGKYKGNTTVWEIICTVKLISKR